MEGGREDGGGIGAFGRGNSELAAPTVSMPWGSGAQRHLLKAKLRLGFMAHMPDSLKRHFQLTAEATTTSTSQLFSYSTS